MKEHYTFWGVEDLSMPGCTGERAREEEIMESVRRDVCGCGRGVTMDEVKPRGDGRRWCEPDKEHWCSHFGKEAVGGTGRDEIKTDICRSEEGVMTGGSGEMMECE